MARRPSWRAVNVHLNYTVDEAARALNVHKGTVRRWLKEDLPAITDRKPAIILGGDLIDFLKARQRTKHPCGPGEFYCLKCRTPRKPTTNLIEVASESPSSVNLCGVCPVCSILMYRRVSCRDLDAFFQAIARSSSEQPAHITDSADTCLNAHFAKKDEPDA